MSDETRPNGFFHALWLFITGDFGAFKRLSNSEVPLVSGQASPPPFPDPSDLQDEADPVVPPIPGYPAPSTNPVESSDGLSELVGPEGEGSPIEASPMKDVSFYSLWGKSFGYHAKGAQRKIPGLKGTGVWTARLVKDDEEVIWEGWVGSNSKTAPQELPYGSYRLEVRDERGKQAAVTFSSSGKLTAAFHFANSGSNRMVSAPYIRNKK